MSQKPTILMILDGFGLSDNTEGNAIKLADTPNIDHVFKTYPWEKGYASGVAVGLSEGQIGNSEVGHLNIGAGRIIYKEQMRITKSIQEGEFFENPVLIKAMDNCKDNNRSLHLFGLLSNEGIHSHITHLYALLEMAKCRNIQNIFVHAFLYSSDTSIHLGKNYLLKLENKMKSIGAGKIATISGYYYAMDRDNHWERIEKLYNAMVLGEGETTDSISKCMDASYAAELKDEFVVPTIVCENDSPVVMIRPLDSVIFYNFRADRARQLTRAFCDPDFIGFKRKNGFFPLTYVCFTEYDETIPYKMVAFPKLCMANTFGEYVSSLGLKQLRISETEKYAHVTYFFSGGVETPYLDEDRVLIPSPKIATYDLQPSMSAVQITDKLIETIKLQKYDIIIINYANCDMVGHTGVLDAAIKAVEIIDICIGRIINALLSVDGQMFICADHGNSEKMIDEKTQQAYTGHTTNPVPFILINAKKAKGIDKGGKLCDIAPTLLELMDIPKPKEMTGRSLIL